MAVMGIESSAHTLGVGISDNGKVIANAKGMYSVGSGGMIPMKVADFHTANVRTVIRNALRESGLKMADIEAIGYTKGPGIGPCLRVAQVAAKTIAAQNRILLYPVNHAIAHIEITKQLFNSKDPLTLYVSGGNSQIVALEKSLRTHYKVYGETFDIGVGNMLDNFAREAKLTPAWGSTVAKAAEGGKYVEMPYSVKGMDFTFTGLLTHAVKALREGRIPLRDAAYSIQETAFSMLVEALERALFLTMKKDVTLCGGVAQSVRLQKMVEKMAGSHGARFFVAPNEYNADNGAMIAVVAEKMHMSGAKYGAGECTIDQKYRIDSVEVTWQ